MLENSWEELPDDMDFTSLTESNDLSTSLSRTSTPPNGSICTPVESPWSPKPSPVPPEEVKEGSKRESLETPSKRFDVMFGWLVLLISRDKNFEHFYRQKKASILEQNENRVRIIDFGVAYNSFKG